QDCELARGLRIVAKQLVAGILETEGPLLLTDLRPSLGDPLRLLAARGHGELLLGHAGPLVINRGVDEVAVLVEDVEGAEIILVAADGDHAAGPGGEGGRPIAAALPLDPALADLAGPDQSGEGDAQDVLGWRLGRPARGLPPAIERRGAHPLMLALVVDAVHPGIEDRLQLVRLHAGDDLRLAGPLLLAGAQRLRLGDIVTGKAGEERGALASEGAEQPF